MVDPKTIVTTQGSRKKFGKDLNIFVFEAVWSKPGSPVSCNHETDNVKP